MHQFGFRRAAALTAAAGLCCVALTGCAWLLGEPERVTGSGQDIAALPSPQSGFAPAPGGKILPRVAIKPILAVKPGDPRAAEADLKRGWSVKNRGRGPAGATFGGVRLDPGGAINPVLLTQALTRVERESASAGLAVLAIADFSLPANVPRWFLVDLKTGMVTAKHVSHGHAKRLCRKGGCSAGQPAGFSLATPAVSASANTDATSLGLYRVVGQRPEGGKFSGPTIALSGLDASNANAQARGIIIHQNPRYFDPKRNLFGRSQGCFVFGPDDLPAVVQALAPGTLIYAGMGPRPALAKAQSGGAGAMN